MFYFRCHNNTETEGDINSRDTFSQIVHFETRESPTEELQAGETRKSQPEETQVEESQVRGSQESHRQENHMRQFRSLLDIDLQNGVMYHCRYPFSYTMYKSYNVCKVYCLFKVVKGWVRN